MPKKKSINISLQLVLNTYLTLHHMPIIVPTLKFPSLLPNNISYISIFQLLERSKPMTFHKMAHLIYQKMRKLSTITYR